MSNNEINIVSNIKFPLAEVLRTANMLPFDSFYPIHYSDYVINYDEKYNAYLIKYVFSNQVKEFNQNKLPLKYYDLVMGDISISLLNQHKYNFVSYNNLIKLINKYYNSKLVGISDYKFIDKYW